MKLQCIFNNSHLLLVLNPNEALSHRVVEIELTPEQEKALKPRELGKGSGHSVFEVLEHIEVKQEACNE